MRGYRFSIGGICLVVVICAVGFAAIRNPTAIWQGAFALLFRTLLALSFVGAICARKERRAAWVGFASFGLTYVLIGIESSDLGILSNAFAQVIFLLSGVDARGAGLLMPGMGGGMGGGAVGGPIHLYAVIRVFLGLIFASVGAVLSHLLFARVRTEASPAVAAPALETRAWPVIRVLFGLVAFGGFAYLALLGSRWLPLFCVAIVTFAAWGCLMLLTIGVAFARGRRRAACLGAILLGGGYLLAISIHVPDSGEYWPEVATHAFLAKIRPFLPGSAPELPPTSDPVAISHARLRAILNRPATVDFLQETPLEDFLKRVNDIFLEADGKPVNIYVDPVGLQEAEKTLTSPISISLQKTRLRTILDLTLKQLGLTYYIRDGMIVVTSASSEDNIYGSLAEARTPYFQIGHCFLAMCATALGAILAPKVYDRVTA